MRAIFRWCLALCAVGLGVSWAGSAAAYTHKLTSTGQPVRWASGVERVVLRVDPAVERMLPAGQAYAAIAIALDAWRFEGVPDVVVGEGVPAAYDDSTRGNGIYVLHDWPFDSKRLAVTVTSYMPSGELLGADVLINGNIEYGLLHEDDRVHAAPARHDLAAVLTHEIGHVLGLDESEADETATMWPFIRAGETHQRSLDQDDEEGIVELYRLSLDVPNAGCSLSAVARHPSQSPRGSSFLLLTAMGLLWVRSKGANRRRR